MGLKLGTHVFNYKIENTFFEAFGFNEFNRSHLQVTLNFDKKPTFFKLMFVVKGHVNVDCDLSLEPYEQEISGTLSLIVKFGSTYNDDNEEVLIIPHEHCKIDVSQYIYELIVLSVPAKRIHPKVLDGTMNSEALNKFKKLEISESKPLARENRPDPRWDTLKSLITEKNI